MTLQAEDVPVLRRRLEQLDKDFGFDPHGHSGKALRHAVGSLPRDLLINLSLDSVRELVMMAMSLADRPRPEDAGRDHPIDLARVLEQGRARAGGGLRVAAWQLT